MRKCSWVVVSLSLFGLACNDGGIAAGANKSPVAEAGDNLILTVNEEVDFDGSASYDEDGSIVNYEWDFGDGETDFGLNVSHAWTAPGEYTVTLTVTDNEGAEGTDTPSVTIDVVPFSGVYAIDSTPTNQLCAGSTASVVVSAMDMIITGGDISCDWHWDQYPSVTLTIPPTGTISGSTFLMSWTHFQDVSGVFTATTANTWTGTFNGDGTFDSQLVQNQTDDSGTGLATCTLTWNDVRGARLSDLP